MQSNVYRDPKRRWVSTLEVIGLKKIDVAEDMWIIDKKNVERNHKHFWFRSFWSKDFKSEMVSFH